MCMKTIQNNALDNNYIVKITSTFKLLSDPTRCKILYLLYKSDDGLCVHEIADAVPISHSAASHQLSRLEDKGVVYGFREGQLICYRLSETEYTNKIISMIKIFNQQQI